MARNAGRPDLPPPRKGNSGPKRGGGRTAQRRRAADEPPGLAGAVGALMMRNPAAVGGGMAFLVALSFVSANALWYQPHRHAGAFFATRPADIFARMGDAAPVSKARPALQPAVDPALKRAQGVLKEMGIYAGAVDGVNGPGTRKAIAAFQTANGLAPTGEMDRDFLDRLAEQSAPTAAIAPETSAPSATERQRVMKVQAGLKAFGNDGIAVDGVIGGRTRGAIREFQSLFGLPETGEPDAVVYAKMKEIGLTD